MGWLALLLLGALAFTVVVALVLGVVLVQHRRGAWRDDGVAP